jgi:hypothetical protein
LLIAVRKSDLVGSGIDPLHGVLGERAANRGWRPWFLRRRDRLRPLRSATSSCRAPGRDRRARSPGRALPFASRSKPSVPDARAF